MSGFEVVGVVLGSLPLLISGLEHYRDGIDTLGDMWQYRERINDLVTSFTSSIARYRLTCENLLGPLILPDAQRAQLLDEPNGEAWHDKDLGIQIEQRLGASYPAYIKLVSRLQKAILKFATKLGLDINNEYKPSWIEDHGQIEKHTLDRFFKKSNRFWRGVMLGFDTKKVDGLLEQIEKDIMRIDNLTSENIKLEVLRQERQPKSTVNYWQIIRDRASRLFEILSSRWSRQCDCEKVHCASLKLEVRDGGLVSTSAGIRFGVLFSYDETTPPATATTSILQDLEIETVECQPRSEMKAKSVRHTQSAKKVVGFSSPPSLDDSDPSATKIMRNGQATPVDEHSRLAITTHQATRIMSLCSIMGQTHRNAVCIGFLDDNSWQHNIYSASCQKLKKSTPVSLHQTLALGLSTKEKYKIALTLASTLLQLSTTPWLQESLGIRDIHFHPEDSNAIGEPYINKSFSPNPNQAPRPVSQSRTWVRNEAIFGLGVLLIELSYGHPLLTYKTDSDLSEGKETYFTEYAVATRLAQGISQREPEYYASAVTRCVHCTFNTAPNFENGALQQDFLDGVVQPLQKLCKVLS